MGHDRLQTIEDRIQYLRDSTDFASTLLASLIGYAIIAADFDGNVIAYNEGAHQIYGYAPEEVIGKKAIEIFFPKEFIEAGKLENITKELIGAGRLSYEGEKVKKDGSRFPAQILFTLTKDKNGQVIGFMEIVQDLTEQKQAEEALEASKVSLRTIIEKSVDGILVVDIDGITHFINPAAESILGRKKEELLGEQFGFPVEPDKTMEIEIVRRDGKLILAEMRGVETEWEGKSAYLLSLRDITLNKQYEESLIKTAEELKKLDAIKSDFISTASHELRTPLASIKNAVDLILSKKAGEITDTQEKFLSMAERNINRLGSLLNDLLNISKIEAGKLELNYSQVDIKNIIENVINTFSSLANEKSISLKMNLAPDLPPIYADASRLEQVLINLVNNAIKFTPARGTIAVDVHKVDGVSDMSEGLAGFLEIAVTDTGIGIPEEHVKHLFEKFYQVESSLSVKKQPGTGLGLAISKGLVEALGGKIQCKSKEGVGSAFSFTLPIIAAEKRFYYMLENELAKARQHHLPLSVLIIKLEGFAHVKEVYGIKECERVLELVKEKIEKKGLKFADKINVSLYNGEIIALIVMPDTSCNGAQVARERIKTYLTGIEIAVGESKYSCSFVSGGATYPDDAKSAEELLDFAMED